jgi:hypothetical protein
VKEFWRLTPLEILARLERRALDRKWLASRIEAIIRSQATGKGGMPLQQGDVFPECRE